MAYPIITAFLIGLFSTLHCLGMCGGIVGALTFSLPPEVRQQRHRLLPYIVSFSAGRIASYSLAGALIGALGGGLYDLFSPRHGYLLLQILAAVMMVGIGFYLAGWLPRFALIERIGEPLWRRLEPLGRHLLPVQSPWQALLYGAIWGWLPCGLVYSALLWSATGAGPLAGAIYMAAFGLGTLPAIVGAGILSGWLGQLRRRPWVRQAAGLTLVAMGLAGVLFADQLQHLHFMFAGQQELQCQQ